MGLAADIKYILTTSTGINSSVDARIYPLFAPEKVTLPCIIYALTGLTPNESKSYANKWDDCDVEVIAIATTLDAAEILGNSIRSIMNRYDGTVSSDRIISCNLSNQFWNIIPDFSYSGASTGVAVYAVHSQFKLMTAQNIAE